MINPFTPTFKKYILPTFWREMYEWGSENIGSIIIFHLSKLSKAKFFIQCHVVCLVRLQRKFDFDHSWDHYLCCFLWSTISISSKLVLTCQSRFLSAETPLLLEGVMTKHTTVKWGYCQLSCGIFLCFILPAICLPTLLPSTLCEYFFADPSHQIYLLSCQSLEVLVDMGKISNNSYFILTNLTSIKEWYTRIYTKRPCAELRHWGHSMISLPNDYLWSSDLVSSHHKYYLM